MFHQLVADDRLAVMLAKALVDLDIAVPGDWKGRDTTQPSFIRITLERWIRAHGGSTIRHRFLLSAVISNSPCNWAERDKTKPNQLFLIVEPSEGTCGCATFGPTLQLLESVHPQLPATSFHLFVGALNRWIRVYDYRDAEDRAETPFAAGYRKPRGRLGFTLPGINCGTGREPSSTGLVRRSKSSRTDWATPAGKRLRIGISKSDTEGEREAANTTSGLLEAGKGRQGDLSQIVTATVSGKLFLACQVVRFL